jgi:tRNA dimethylallyltransferase
MRRVMAICGPTAVGKSEVAERVAELVGAEIVSVDSMQVYRGMDIGTAKVPEAERCCPLHMVDVVDVSVPYAVAEFQRDARACVEDIAERGLVPILCGGTGLYLDAVVDEMDFPKGEATDSRRAAYEAQLEAIGPDALHQILADRDPKSAAEIHPNNTRRVIRALEMLDEGVSYSEQRKGLKRHEPHFEVELFALTMDRETLYARIDRRVELMFEQGLVDEVRTLEEQGLAESHTASQAIGYKEVLQYLRGEISEREALTLVQKNTRRYAKRQLSWLRRDGRATWIDVGDVSRADAAEAIARKWRQP